MYSFNRFDTASYLVVFPGLWLWAPKLDTNYSLWPLWTNWTAFMRVVRYFPILFLCKLDINGKYDCLPNLQCERRNQHVQYNEVIKGCSHFLTSHLTNTLKMPSHFLGILLRNILENICLCDLRLCCQYWCCNKLTLEGVKLSLSVLIYVTWWQCLMCLILYLQPTTKMAGKKLKAEKQPVLLMCVK